MYTNIKCLLNVILINYLAICVFAQTNNITKDCSEGQWRFELITGHVFTSPSETMTMVPGTLQLTDCIAYCNRSETCKAINFETGLCIILTSSAQSQPSALTTSQFPVFTIYAQKVCITEPNLSLCDRPWLFERVIGYELRKFEKKRVKVDSREKCMAMCLNENGFTCRSANYDNNTGECIMSDMDRHTISSNGPTASGLPSSHRYFVPASVPGIDYLENNCVQDPKKMCDFKEIKGKILKTVDHVHLNVKTVDECKAKCLESPYRCFSFDLGDPSNSVCRTSHLDRSSLTHIEDPYLNIPGSMTYELSSCYNITIVCKAKEMVASVQTSKVFNGKIYAKSKPNSCVSDIKNSLDFEIIMPYHDLMCDVKQENSGKFSNDIIIQHHDMIVTTLDKGLSVHCNYDLSNRSISNVALDVDDDVATREDWMNNVHSATVAAPNVTMKITNQQGFEIESANVGDSLSLRFEVLEKSSPYEIFVRELVAVDGVDSSEILLIDSSGCPTDASIMGQMGRVDGSGQVLSASFDAFKFPTSDIVQFRALVTPCLPNCEPVQCEVNGLEGRPGDVLSYGKRRRRSLSSLASPLTETKNSDEEEMVVVQTIKIVDTFNNQKGDSKKSGSKKVIQKGSTSNQNVKNFKDENVDEETNEVNFDSEKRVNRRNLDSPGCASFLGLIMACSLFLIAQLFLILAWCLIWWRKQKKGFPSFSPQLTPTNSSTLPYFNSHHHHHNQPHQGKSSPTSLNKFLISPNRTGSIGGHSLLSNSSSHSSSSSVANKTKQSNRSTSQTQSSYGAHYLTPFSSYHRKFAEPRKTAVDMYSSMSQLYQ
ncbi:uncharacterized protein LOC107362058 [Tetranychus urticae]|uniref:ZP domain-containing protein n=1 Tax=Tetranychus urticae TaxID=32264 RepID=T1K882_TETUR|nr:uncharacterized protein LOC107362058 [Tetranychus urticae]